jgi:ABC-type transporter Mla subunit MlaD
MNVGTLFLDLLRNYAVYGWPFLVLHLVVLGLSVYTWIGLRREIAHLSQWAPGSPAGGSQATGILDQFIDECQKLGAQGFFVPMTDFTDRLDSIVSGKVTELYERVNLFLTVGIGGTLFGVFEFAFRSAAALHTEATPSGERVAALGSILSESLAKAFPVGFVGLGLMFLGQLFGSFLENRLHQALAGATSKALHRRMEVSHAQAQVVADAAKRIETALAPIQNLQAMMVDTLGPVVKELGERLEQSLGLVKAQFGELERTTAGFSSAVADLRSGVATLEKNTEHLGGLLRQAPEVLGQLGELQRGQEEALQAFQANLRTSLQASERTLQALEIATQASQDLPGRILAATQEALESVSRYTSAVSLKVVDELRQRITADYNLLLQTVGIETRALRESILATSGELSRHLAESSDTLFGNVRGQTDALQGLIVTTGEQLGRVGTAARDAVVEMQQVRNEARASLESAFTEMGQESRQRWGQMTDEFGRQAQDQFIHFVEGIQESALEIRNSLGEAAKSWGDVAANADTIIQGPILRVLEDVGGELRKGVRDLDSLIAQRYPEAVRDVSAFTGGLQQLVSRVETVQNLLDRWLQSLDQSRASVEETLRVLQRQMAQPTGPVQRPDSLAPVLTEMRRIDQKLDSLLQPQRRSWFSWGRG